MNNSLTSQSQLIQDFQTQNHTIQSQINQSQFSENSNKKRQRRSKHEQNGRIFTCEYCGKSYLSKPALNNHMNTKHSEILKELHIEKKKRGRPRKYFVDNNENNYGKLKFNPFFQNLKRGKTDLKYEVINIKNVVDKVFNDLFVKYGKNFSKIIQEPIENPILNYLLNKRELDLKICDDIICKYLSYIETFTNENYFIFVIKFLILFRECVNVTFKKHQKYFEKDFTTIENAEILPEQCNEFFSNFLEKYQFFDFNDDDKNELIEIIQHFCFWLFINNFTRSKLSLAS